MKRWIDKARMIAGSRRPVRRLGAILLKKTGAGRFLRIRLDGFDVRFFPTAQSASAWYDSRLYVRESRILRRLVVPGAACIDVGANIGLAAIPMAQAAGPGGRVLAVEPDPRIASYLAENLRLNGLSQVEVVSCALGAETGQTTFSRCAADDMSHVAGPGEAGGPAVALRTLDDVAAGLGGIHLVKIDVEGFEREVVRGGQNALGRTALVYVEMSRRNCARYGHDPVRLLDDFVRLGFRMYRIQDGKLFRAEPDESLGASTENLIGTRSMDSLLGWEFISR